MSGPSLNQVVGPRHLGLPLFCCLISFVLYSEAPGIRLSITDDDQPSPTSLDQGENTSTIIPTAHKTSSVPALQEKQVNYFWRICHKGHVITLWIVGCFLFPLYFYPKWKQKQSLSDLQYRRYVLRRVWRISTSTVRLHEEQQCSANVAKNMNVFCMFIVSIYDVSLILKPKASNILVSSTMSCLREMCFRNSCFLILPFKGTLNQNENSFSSMQYLIYKDVLHRGFYHQFT